MPTARRRAGAAPATRGVPERIADAAFELFADQGYESTTIETITARAGVARRTFFRHYRSKDDVILPDHQRLVAAAADRLVTTRGLSPLAAVCDAVRLVFDSYTGAPERSVARYHLTRSVPELRDREITSVEPYQRLFAHYLTERTSDPLTSELGAAAVVAAHNHVLRGWLRAGGDGPARADLDTALAQVIATFERPAVASASVSGLLTVVAVLESALPATAVATRLQDMLGPLR